MSDDSKPLVPDGDANNETSGSLADAMVPTVSGNRRLVRRF